MKSIFKTLAVFTFILLASALAAPALFRLQSVSPFDSIISSAQSWAHFSTPFKFEKIFNRLVMIQALAAIFIFLRFRKDTFSRYGLVKTSNALPLIAIPFIATVLALAFLTALRFFAGKAVWDPDPLSLGGWMGRILLALMTGLLVAGIEEFFFRGYMFKTLRQAWGGSLWPSLLVTNISYTLIHFISLKEPFIGPEPTFFDSLKLLQAPFLSLVDWRLYFTQAIGLFALGGVLNILFIQTKSLYASIGLHAGGVFFIKMDGLLVDSIGDASFLFGTNEIVDGALTWAMIVALGGMMNRILKSKVNSPLVPALVLLIVLPLGFSSSALAAEKKGPKPLYIFHEQLLSAEAAYIVEDKEPVPGKWLAGGFIFIDHGIEAKIASASAGTGKDATKQITFNPIEGEFRRLRFKNVPPAPKLVVNYQAINQGSAEDEDVPIYLNFRVLVGAHELKRIRVAKSKVQIKEVISLGPAAFLKGELPVTFEISADNAKNILFSFNAQTQAS